MKFQLMNIKNQESRNGFSMTCDLLINNFPVCRMRDKGDGSEPSFDIFNHKLYSEWEFNLSTLPPVYIAEYDMYLEISKCMFIDLLHASLVNKTNFKLLA